MTDKPMTNAKPAAAAAQAEPEVTPEQLTKMVLEIGPIGVFFGVNWFYGMFWGTGAFMIATAVSLVLSLRLLGRIPVMPLVSAVVLFIFGSLTLLLRDDTFIKLKPTIVNCLFAGALLGGLAFRQLLLKIVFEDAFRITDEGWRLLTIRWALFFLFLAFLNELIWRTQSNEFWISFKFWGVMPLTMAFAIAQLGLIKRYETPRNVPSA